jgi:A/G-specific adenine glycosylase
MLQQTQARTVIPYFKRFLERFPDLESLARAPEQDVLELWAGLGYYSRARNLHRASMLMMGKYGKFPRDFAEILSLPGVGRYTAGAICSLAFNQVQPVVDGNVRRVIARLEGLRKGAAESYFWDRMSLWISQKYPADFNQAMMELGAMVCIPSHPLCSQCPVAKFCKAKELGIQDEIPAARTRRASQHTQVVILILEKKRRLLLTSLQKLTIVPGEWGLPCSQVLRGESAKEAAEMLCRRIFGGALPLLPCAAFNHSITHHRIKAYGFLLSGSLRTPRLKSTKGFRWVDFSECGRLLTSSLFHKALMQSGTTGTGH